MSIEIELTAMANGPDAIGRHDGRAIFVPYAIAGETVRVELADEKPSYARARLLEVLTPSPDRSAPACKHYGECGGCQYQHLAYSAQARWKHRIVVEQFQRIGGVQSPNVLPTFAAPEPLHYRNHIQFSQLPDGALGFYAQSLLGDKHLIPISECPIAHPAIMALAAQLDIEKLDVDQISVRAGADDDLMIVFESASGSPPDVELDLPVSVATLDKDGNVFTMIGSDHVVMKVADRLFRVSAGSFFQVNISQAEALVQLTLEALALKGAETVLDLYCGVGLFSAFIAPGAAQVIGVESSASAVGDAEVNLDGFQNVSLYESPVELAMEHIVNTLSADTVRPYVVLDPPRAGCDKGVIAALVRLGAPRLVYVSCDPATLARDAKRLIAGGYRLRSAQPVDMFPQTYHIETVAVFDYP